MRMPQTVTLSPASSTTVTLMSSIPLPSSVAGETLFAHVSLSNGINTDATFQVQAQATATSPTVATPQEVGVNVVANLTAGEPGTASVGLYNSTSSPVVVNTVTVEIFPGTSPGQGSAQPLSSGSAGPVTIPPNQIQTVTVSLPTLPTSYYGPAYAAVYINGQFEVNIGVTISPPPSQSGSPTSTLQTASSTTSTTSSSTSQTSPSSSQCSPIWWNGLMSTLDEAMTIAQQAKAAFPGCQIAVWVATPSWSGYKPLYAVTFSTASQSYVSNTVFGGGAQASLYTVV
jgi:hypothetical protein